MSSEDGLFVAIVCAIILVVGMLLGGIVQDGIDDVKINNLISYIDTLEKYNNVDLSTINATLENDEIIAWGETIKLRDNDI